MDSQEIILRPATAGDQAAIEQIIDEADINPNHLDWERFVVVEIDGRVVGTGQVKPHNDGTRELASIAVTPAHQKKGIASMIIRELLSHETEPLYLMCESQAEPFYERFGFRRLEFNEFPHDLARIRRAIKIKWPEFEPSIMKQRK